MGGLAGSRALLIGALRPDRPTWRAGRVHSSGADRTKPDRASPIERKGERPLADRLKGKVAVVTGAAPRGEGVGNGMACAILFAREGAKVVLVNRDAGRAETLARQIAAE